MIEINFLTLFLCFSISLIITYVNITFIYHNLAKYISVAGGPQKIHKGNISRLGGVSIFLCIFFMSLISIYEKQNLFLSYFIICIPVFIFGIVEDFTQSISPKLRLFGALLSAVMFVLMFDTIINEIGIGYVDNLLKNNFLSILITILCIIYLIQAFNIIDGLNGLSLTTAIMCLLSIGFIFFKNGDIENSNFALHLIFILIGVLVFNFPFGKIFIGDSGAYIIGLFVASLSIILAEKNISPFVVVQILIFPSYELFRSFCRRFIKDKKSILRPDKKHLHSLLYIYNSKKFLLKNETINAFSSIQIIMIQLINFLYLIYFYHNEKMVILGIIMFIIIYEIFYNIIIFRIKKT